MNATLTPEEQQRERRVTIVRRIVITLIVIACGWGLVIAAQHTRRGDDTVPLLNGSPRPGVVEQISPAPESSVLSQAQVLVDLTSAYDANLVVDGKSIPNDQVVRRPELNQVLFTPGPGKVIEKYEAGRNCVQANVFRVDGTPEQQAPVSWCFNVT